MSDLTKKKINQDAFLALVRVGLWEKEVRLMPYQDIEWKEVYRFANEQSVLGLALAGLEKSDLKPPKELLLQWIGEVQVIEQRNKAMNAFIAETIGVLREQDIYALLVKGQGVAQCYERPLWRSCGDIDLFLSEENYEKAKKILSPLASNVEKEDIPSKHQGLTISNWVVELHGLLYSSLSPKISKGLEIITNDTFFEDNVRSWSNGGIQVFLLALENDVIYTFYHFLGHFYKGGIGLRQICDWCRLLWVYKDSLNHKTLEVRIRKMGLLSEWKAFGAFAVEYLGMPTEAMPFYSSNIKWKKKAKRICTFILEVGNFGHNRDNSYYRKYPYMIRKAMSFGRRCSDLLRHTRIFPMDSVRFFPSIAFNGVRSVLRGE